MGRIGRRLSGRLGRAVPGNDLGFQQRVTVRIENILGFPALVRHQAVPVEAKQVEAFLLVNPNDGFGGLLPFHPNVLQAGLRFVLNQVVRRVGIVQIMSDGIPLLGINDPCDLIRRSRLHEISLVEFFADQLRSIDGVFGLGQRLGVDDCDLAGTRLGGVDAIQDKLILTQVIDVDTGIAVRYLQAPVAGAQNLAGDGDLAAGRDDLVHHNGLLVVIEITFDRHAIVAEGNTRERITVVVQEGLGAIRFKVRGYLQRDGLYAALNQAIHVQVRAVMLMRPCASIRELS